MPSVITREPVSRHAAAVRNPTTASPKSAAGKRSTATVSGRKRTSAATRVDVDRVLVFAKRLEEEREVDAVLIDAEVGDRPGVVADRRLVDVEPGRRP